jgi:hypothetical protein
MKDEIGTFIFDYIKDIVGEEKAPKICGMLIDLQLDNIRQNLISYYIL